MTRSDYQRPLLSLPTQWPTMAEKGTENGWRFSDPRLSRVIEQVLESNNDLAAAALTLQQARVAAGLTSTNISPDVRVSGAASNSKNVRRGAPPQENYSGSVAIAWELDLLGSHTKADVGELIETSATTRELLSGLGLAPGR